MLAAGGVDVCVEYGVALAVEDFVPCVLAAVALVVLARTIRARLPRAFPAAVFGAVVISVGGFAKATWKLLVATGCWEYPWLEQLLFPSIAFGFAAMAWSLWSLYAGRTIIAWPFVAFPLGAAIGAVWMGDQWPFLIAAAVGATVFGIVGAAFAFRGGKKSVGILFIIYVVGTNVLPPLAARPDQTEQVQWMAQLTNSAIQFCFLLGALWIRDHMTKVAPKATEQETGVPA